VSFCAITGIATAARIASPPLSEQALAVQMILKRAGRMLHIGDRNFGVWRVELNFRSLKCSMDTAPSEAKSPEMVQKEFYAGLMAYNLVCGLMALGELPTHRTVLYQSPRTAGLRAERIIHALHIPPGVP
jgi:hypothetical protein